MGIRIVGDLLFLIALIICVASSIQEIKNGARSENETKTKECTFLQKYGNILFLLILLIFAINVGYKLGQVPQGLHVDEAGALYDAICISKYGMDRYLYKLPVYLINFGGGQSALYAYLATVTIKIFGISIISFRLPAVILSFISIICFYQMIKENYGKSQALFSAFVLAIAPWNIMKSRWGLDCNLMGSMMIISMYLLTKAVNKNKQYLYIISGIFLGMTLYTYVISYLVVPIVLGIILIYLFMIKKMNMKNVICLAIPLGILAIPLLMMIAYNSGAIESVKIPIFSIPKLWFFRGGEIAFKNIPENLKNIFDLLFIKDFLNYNAIPAFGTLYKLSIPLVFFGFIEVFREVIKKGKQKEFCLDFVMLVTFVVELCAGLLLTELNINKLNAIYIPMIYFAGKFLNFINKNLRYGALIMILCYTLNYAIFMPYYFTDFAHNDLFLFENDIMQASSRAEEISREKIYVENALNQTYIYTLIANPISPYEFNENLQINENGIVTEYGKYRFWISEEIEKEAIYMIKNNTSKIDELVEAGFQLEKYGEFSLLWYSV